LQLLPVPTMAPPAEAAKMMKEASTIHGKKVFKVLTPLLNQTMMLTASTLMLSPIMTLMTSMNMIQIITVMRETSYIAPMDPDPRRMSTAASTIATKLVMVSTNRDMHSTTASPTGSATASPTGSATVSATVNKLVSVMVSKRYKATVIK